MNVNRVNLFTHTSVNKNQNQNPSFGKWDMKSHDYFIKNDDAPVSPKYHPEKAMPGGTCSIMRTSGDDICDQYQYCTHAALRLLRDTDDIIIKMGPKGKPVAEIKEQEIIRKIKQRKGTTWRYFPDPKLKKICNEGMESSDLRFLSMYYYNGFYAPPRDEPLCGPDIEKEDPPGWWNIGLD